MRRPFSSVQRWPLVTGEATTERRHAARITAASVGLLLVGIAVALAGTLPGPARIAIAVAGAAPLGWALVSSLRTRRAPRAKASGTFLEASAGGLSRVTPDGTKPIVKWDAPFGVTLLASYGRPTALLAFTTPTQTRYVPARIDGREAMDDDVLARIAVLADLDLVDGVAHDAALSPASTVELVRYVALRSKDAPGRAYLSDGRGAPIALDRATLSVGDRTFDLTSGLEWRPLMFHESTGQAAALYQATWIRQGTVEVVLVAPMPASIVPRDAERDAHGKLSRALTRDLRLLQAPAEPPPAREARVAIDRPFMMAVRRVLDDAPLALRLPPAAPGARTRTEGRGSHA
jgi:hypothetical protein